MLFNLKDDPREAHNLAESNAEQAAALREELDRWQVETKAPIPTERNPESVLNNAD